MSSIIQIVRINITSRTSTKCDDVNVCLSMVGRTRIAIKGCAIYAGLRNMVTETTSGARRRTLTIEESTRSQHNIDLCLLNE